MSLCYYVPDHGEKPEDAHPVPAWILNQHNIVDGTLAELCAEYEHDNRDGWESSWPLTFVFTKDGAEVGRFEVDREYDPTFHAARKEADHV